MRLLSRRVAEACSLPESSSMGMQRERNCVALHEFEDKITPYAILSHTWGKKEDEVTFQDLEAGKHDKAGFAKIEFTLNLAEQEKISYAWIDTCCINKHNFTELGKAINLMYEWYARSTVCYVYLSDVHNVSLGRSRWFTRGWTLQELIAPTRVEFYDGRGGFLGTRESLAPCIEQATGIPSRALHGQLEDFPIVDRFRWSINRVTKEPEDKSHCVVGLLGVKMQCAYGLGEPESQYRLFEAVGRKYGVAVADELKQAGWNAHQSAPQSTYVPGKLKEALQFDYFESRRVAISNPLYATCTWLLNHPAYLQWLERQFYFLWIKGHPGTGKSTLIKFADLKTEAEERTIRISFYFNARGVQLEKSTEGMYRTLLAQIFEKLPNVEEQVQRRMRIENLSASSWTLGQLKDMFQLSVERLGGWRIRCFVDALDECRDAEIQDMINFFRDVARASPQRLVVCMASRYYPALSIKDSVEIRLDQQRQHRDDLRRYIFDRLDVDDEEIKEAVCAKANGVFMWAVLVVRLLNPQLIEGVTYNIASTISNLPPELDGLYREIANLPGANMERFQLCVQFVLLSRRPMRGHVFHDALLYGLGLEVQHGTVPSRQVLERFVASSSRGLAELTPGDRGIVQFIHESVRDFLLKHSGLQDLFPDVRQEIIPWSHDKIKATCVRCIRSASDFQNMFDQDLYDDLFDEEVREPDIARRSPFLLYSVNAVVFHAEQAALSISQDEFVATMDWRLLLSLHIAFRAPNSDNLSEQMSAAHLFACYDAVRLMSSAARLHYDISSATDGLSPIAVALQRRAFTVVRQLLVYGVDINCCAVISIALNAMEGQLVHCKKQLIWRPQNARFLEKYCTALNGQEMRMSAWMGSAADVVQLLLLYGADIHQRGDHGDTALITASRCRSEKAVEILLSHGAQANLSNNDGETALMHAHSDPNIVRCLLEHGADANISTPMGTTALMENLRNLECARLLLEHTAFVDAQSRGGTTALMYACLYSRPDVVSLLLERGASTDAVNRFGRTALWYACGRKDVKISDAMVKYYASVNVIDSTGRSLLHWAVERTPLEWRRCSQGEDCGHIHILRALLARGADATALNARGETPLMIAEGRGDVCGNMMAGQLFISASSSWLDLM